MSTKSWESATNKLMIFFMLASGSDCQQLWLWYWWVNNLPLTSLGMHGAMSTNSQKSATKELMIFLLLALTANNCDMPVVFLSHWWRQQLSDGPSHTTKENDESKILNLIRKKQYVTTCGLSSPDLINMLSSKWICWDFCNIRNINAVNWIFWDKRISLLFSFWSYMSVIMSWSLLKTSSKILTNWQIVNSRWTAGHKLCQRGKKTKVRNILSGDSKGTNDIHNKCQHVSPSDAEWPIQPWNSAWPVVLISI